MLLGLLVFAACSANPSGSEAPLTTAHRAAAGYWPANSRAAVSGSIAAGFEAIEVDVLLTKDGVPVLAHDPVLDPEECTTARGKELEEPVRIDSVRWMPFRRTSCVGVRRTRTTRVPRSSPSR